MSKVVISTLSDETIYTAFNDVGTLHKVRVKANGRTEVSDDEAELLAAHGIFQQHVANGFVSIEAG